MARKGSNIVYDGENISFKEFYNAFGPNVQISKVDVGVDIDWEKEQHKDKELSVILNAIKTNNKNELDELENSQTWKQCING
ncbi:hypothetical protein BpHYR1_051800 [Brachionus plicatilis]|uniref:Uncharacterized protein n=1 Tax=Brachionus plicatilis TaxID=10195 RepID=A0A3M7P9B9_BRAPC|nr:hypothetical protein BpHYR1_051800 [Brachionus plicatilis]